MSTRFFNSLITILPVAPVNVNIFEEALVLLLLTWWQENRKAGGQGAAAQNPSGTLFSSSTFDATSYFARAYVSALYQEVENNVRAAAHLNSPKDHEAFYAKLIALGLPGFTYEIVWAYIFRSQVLAFDGDQQAGDADCGSEGILQQGRSPISRPLRYVFI